MKTSPRALRILVYVLGLNETILMPTRKLFRRNQANVPILTIMHPHWMTLRSSVLALEKLIRYLGVVHCQPKPVIAHKTQRQYGSQQTVGKLLHSRKRGLTTFIRTLRVRGKTIHEHGFPHRRLLRPRHHHYLHRLQISHGRLGQDRSLESHQQFHRHHHRAKRRTPIHLYISRSACDGKGCQSHLHLPR